MKKKYIIWDFDGTLVNTNDIIVESWMATYEHFLGRTPSEMEIVATLGETLKHTVEANFPGERYEDVRDYYRAYQDAHCEGKVYVFPGVMDVLDELKAMGCSLAVATSRTEYSYSNYVKQLGLEGYMDVVVTMEDVSRHKPDPESVEKVLERFGASPDEALMLGDTLFDIGCANNAGVDSIMVGWSHPVDAEAMAAKGFVPTYRISSPAELIELI